MFDFRYHALSLTAVIVALVLGVLLGVAIGDRGLVSSGEKALRSNLGHAIASAKHHATDLQAQLDARNDVFDNAYPLLVKNQLAGRDVGMVFLGPTSKTDEALVSKAIGPAGANNLKWVMSLKEPLDVAAVAADAKGTPYAQLGDDPALYAQLGRRVGYQLVTGGRLLTRAQSSLSDSFSGELAPVSTIVLVHDPPSGLDGQQKATARSFEQGVVAGLREARATVVGVQTEKTKPSQTSWYHSNGLTSVSDLDQVEGRVSLIYGLTGCATGTRFGHGTHEQLLPDVTSCG